MPTTCSESDSPIIGIFLKAMDNDMPARILIIALICVLFAATSMAQVETVVFDLFDEADGLHTSATIGVFQDSDGLLWFNTFDGLVRYDGYNMKTYRRTSSCVDCLSSNFVTCVFEDAAGRLWVGTGDAGINVSDTTKERYNPVIGAHGDTLVYSGAIYDITSDSRGNIWVAGDRGIDIVQVQNENVTRAKKLNTTMRGAVSGVTALAHHNDRIWIGTSDGICYFSESSGKLHTPGTNPELLSFPIDDLAEDREGRIWASCKGNRERMFYWDNSRQVFEPLKNIPFRNLEKRLHFDFDLDNRLWMSVFEDQIYGFDLTDSVLFLQSSINSNITDERFLRRPFCDHSGRMWIPFTGYLVCEYFAGVHQYYHPFGFHQFSTAIYKDRKNTWLAYREAGVVRIDNKTGPHQSLFDRPKLESTAPD